MAATGSALSRILVIDDDARVRQLFDDSLTWLGHEVDTVASGIEALAILEVRPYSPGASALETSA